MFTRLCTDVADPLERLRKVSDGNRTAKEHQGAIPASALQDWAELAAPHTFAAGVRLYSSLRLAEKHPVVHNLVVSNVPGPPVPIYFMGGRVEGVYPLGPVFHGAGLNITVISSDGRLHVGLIACAEQMPRPWDLADELALELEALVKEVGDARPDGLTSAPDAAEMTRISPHLGPKSPRHATTGSWWSRPSRPRLV